MGELFRDDFEFYDNKKFIFHSNEILQSSPITESSTVKN